METLTSPLLPRRSRLKPGQNREIQRMDQALKSGKLIVSIQVIAILWIGLMDHPKNVYLFKIIRIDLAFWIIVFIKNEISLSQPTFIDTPSRTGIGSIYPLHFYPNKSIKHKAMGYTMIQMWLSEKMPVYLFLLKYRVGSHVTGHQSGQKWQSLPKRIRGHCFINSETEE